MLFASKMAQFVIRVFLFLLMFSQQLYAENEQISIQLKWLHQFQFAGYYAAKEKGFFAEAGLDVELKERNPSSSQIDDVLQGYAEYGVSDAGLVLSRMQGKPVVMLSQIFQHSPLVLIALGDSGIKSAYDLKSKKIMTDIKSNGNASLLAMMLKALGSLDSIDSVPQNYKKSDLLEGKVDAMSAYISSQPFWYQQKNKTVNIIDPRDYGINFYGDNLFTSEEELMEHPQRVEKVIRAVKKGWLYALDNPHEIVDIIMEKYATQGQSRDHLLYEAKITREMILPEFVELGSYERSRYEKMAQVYAQLHFVDHAVVDQRFFYDTAANLQIPFTQQEKLFIQNNPLVKFTGDPNWLPYEAFTEDGEYVGVVADHLKLVEKYTGIEFEPIPVTSWTESLRIATESKVSVISGDAADVVLNKLFTPIKTYSQNPIVIVMDHEQTYVDDLFEISDKRIAIIKNYGYTADIFSHYPEIDFIEVENIQEGLEGIVNGRHDAMLATMALASFHIAEMGLHNVRVVGKTPIIMDLTLFISKEQPVLHSIMEKTLQHIPASESRDIIQSWIKRDYVEKSNYLMVFIVAAVSMILLSVFFYWNQRLAREIKMRLASEKELEYLATHDVLTRINNRLSLDRHLPIEFERAKRYKHTLSVFMLDIDHFKKINDQYGHHAGDAVLMEIGVLLKQTFRQTDYIARYGGEEFVVILPETDKHTASEFAERLRTKIESYQFSDDQMPLPEITISIGVASYPSSAQDWEALIKCADDALYKAKENGRNKIIIAQ